MRTNRFRSAGPLLAAALCCLAALAAPSPLPAQDVLRAGDAYGIQAPQWVIETLQRNPDAFTFKRAWKDKVRRIRENRRALRSRLRSRLGPGPRLLTSAALARAEAAVTGTLRVPVALGLYSDATAPYPVSDYQARLFGESSGRYSLTTFYREMSLGAFEIDGTVYGWTALPEPAAYYEPSDTIETQHAQRYGRAGEFMRDVLTRLDPNVDFGRFDNDGPDGVPNSGDDDGYVDVMAFLYPSAGKNCGGPGIWPHRWVYEAWWGAPFETDDPSAEGGMIKVSDYIIQPGIACDGSSLMPIGTMAHELGHALALPDLYDTDSSNGESTGLGHWGLMASGSYNRPNSPAHMSAWSKNFLGWLDVRTVTQTTSVTLEPVYEHGRVLRYSIPYTDEYFLLEHRTQTGADQYLHGPGLLIYHIDQGVINNTLFQNAVNADEDHKGVDIEEADGLDELDEGFAGTGDRGDAGDPYPGSTGQTLFGASTYPSSAANDGSESGFRLENIQYASGTLTFDAVISAVSPPDTTTAVALGDSITGTVTASEPDTIAIRLEAGDTADFGLFARGSTSGGFFSTGFTLLDPSGQRISIGEVVHSDPRAVIIAGQPISSTGTYRLVVETTFPAGADYIVRTRTSGPVVGGALRTIQFVEQGAAAVQDTLFLRNYGTGTTTVRITTGGAPWLSVTPTSVTLDGIGASAAPVVAAARRTPAWRGWGARKEGAESARIIGRDGRLLAAPDGARRAGPVDIAALRRGAARMQAARAGPSPAPGFNPVVVTLDPAGLSLGIYHDSLVFDLPDDVWNSGGTIVGFAVLRLSDPDARTVATPQSGYPNVFGPVVVAPNGDLLVWEPDDDGGYVSRLIRIDPATGDRMVEASLPGVLIHAYADMELGPDGAIYVAGDLFASKLIRIASDGGVSTLYTTDASGLDFDVEVLPDGSVYVQDGGSLLRIAADGTTTEVLSGLGRIGSIVYHPGDDGIYFATESTSADVLRRFDPETGTLETVAPLPEDANGYLLGLEVGASGRLYAQGNNLFGPVLVLGPDGTLVKKLWQPSVGFSLALGEDTLYGSGFFLDPQVWALPVNDGPARPRPETGVRLAVVPARDTLTRTASVPVRLRAYLDSVDVEIGAASGRFTFDANNIVVDSIVAGSYGGALATDLSMQADSGYVRFSVANASPPPPDTLTLAVVYVSAVTEGGDSTTLALRLDELVSAGGEELRPAESRAALVRNATGVWGDVDYTYRTVPERGALNAKDALICLGAVVSKDVSAFDTAACDVVPDDNGQYDGTVSARDALSILKAVVGLDTSGAPRVGENRD